LTYSRIAIAHGSIHRIRQVTSDDALPSNIQFLGRGPD